MSDNREEKVLKLIGDLIAKGEADEGYDSYNKYKKRPVGRRGGKLYTTKQKKSLRAKEDNWKSITKSTIEEVMQRQLDDSYIDPNGNTVSKPRDFFAVGRYQFIPETLQRVFKSAKRKGLLTKDDLFDSKAQDILLKETLLEKENLKKLIEGRRGNQDTIKTNAMKEMAKIWASLPVPEDTKKGTKTIKKGASYYSGDGVNKAHIKLKDVDSVLNSVEKEVRPYDHLSFDEAFNQAIKDRGEGGIFSYRNKGRILLKRALPKEEVIPPSNLVMKDKKGGDDMLLRTISSLDERAKDSKKPKTLADLQDELTSNTLEQEKTEDLQTEYENRLSKRLLDNKTQLDELKAKKTLPEVEEESLDVLEDTEPVEEDVLDKTIKLKKQYESLKNPTTEIEDTEQPETEELELYDPLPNYGKKDGGVRYEDGGVDLIDRTTDSIKKFFAPNPDEEELENSEALNRKLAAQDITDNSGPISAGVGEQNLTQNKQPVKKEEPLTMERLESKFSDLMKAREEERNSAAWLTAASQIAAQMDKLSARPLGIKPINVKAGNVEAQMKDLLALGKLKGLGATRPMSEYEAALVSDREKARTLAEKKLAAYTKEKQADRKLAEKKLALKPKTMTELEKIETKASVKDKYELAKENRKIKREAEDALQKLEEQEKLVDSALADLNDLTKHGALGLGAVDTGPLDALISSETPRGKSLKTTLNKLSLKEMAATFKGMAKAIDSDAERKFFQAAQPSMEQYPKKNLEILNDLKANIESLKAKTRKKIDSYDSKGNPIEQAKPSPSVGSIIRHKDKRYRVINEAGDLEEVK